MTLAICFDNLFKDHKSQHEHPEKPERLDAIWNGLQKFNIYNNAKKVAPRQATIQELETVHTSQYIEQVLKDISQGSGNLDPDTFFSPGTKNAALCAAGSGIDLCQMVHKGDAAHGFAAVRPPGHHATSDKAYGFCIFNNIAIAAATLLKENPGQKVVIFDPDVHHGNGTQDIFYNNPDVLYISIHQSPHFPGSGQLNETGGPLALDSTINIPLPYGMTDADYLFAVSKVVIPSIKAFNPDHILVSAGFDAHNDDFLSSMNLSTTGFGKISAAIKDIANITCNGRVTFFLEGGYNLQALEESVCSTLTALNSSAPISESDYSAPSSASIRVIETLTK